MCNIATLKLDCNIYHPVSPRDLRESDANGFVQRAISAANVYNNIVKYIDDANITSLTTFNLSQRAEDVRYTKKHTACIRRNARHHSAALSCALCFRPSLGSICSSGTWWNRATMFSRSLCRYVQNKLVRGFNRMTYQLNVFTVNWPLLYLSVTEVEIEVLDKMKYIEETKETMDKNTNKLAEIVEGISGIHKGKTLLSYFKVTVWRFAGKPTDRHEEQILYLHVQYRGRSAVCLAQTLEAEGNC